MAAVHADAFFDGEDAFSGATVGDRKNDVAFVGKIELPEVLNRQTPPAEALDPNAQPF